MREHSRGWSPDKVTIKAPDEITQIVKKSYPQDWIAYNQAQTHQIHFTGSIAHHFRVQLAMALEKQGFLLGKIEQAPMQNLIKYHLQNI